MIEKIKNYCLMGAELVDAWRLFPRMFVGLYAVLMYKVFMWFKSIPTVLSLECNAELIEKLVLNQSIPLEQAQEIACTVTAVLGGPTTQHTVLVTTICGLATAIFGFYANSGRNWASLPPLKKQKKEPTILNEDM